VVQAWDLLAERKTSGKKVVIIGGNAVGLETALYLSRQGTLSAEVLHFLMTCRAESVETLRELLDSGDKDVTVVEMSQKVGQDIGSSTRWSILAELDRLGVTTLHQTKAVKIAPDGLEIEKNGKTDFLAANTIVTAVGSTPENALAGQIDSLVPEIHVVGDAKEPRNALDAVREGFLAGLKI
jgi:2,4-dienoyl-CoA reductase (NADPH2)